MRRVLVIFGLLLLPVIVFTLSLTQPTWDPSVVFTNDTLNCSWSFSGDTQAQNITILQDGEVWNSTYENKSLQNLTTSALVPSAATSKSEVWTCRIIIYDNSSSQTKSRDVTIKNSPPTTEGDSAGVFNDSGSDIGFIVQIQEDSTINIDVNATDADADVLTYLSGEHFCSRQSSTLGTYSCTPTQSDLTNNQPTQYNVTFTVTDGQNPAGRTVIFNVTPVNSPATVSVSDQQTPVNESLNYTFAATDEEPSYPLTYVLIFNSSNAEIQDKLSITTLNANGTSVSIYYDASSPDFNDIGAWPIFINVTDNGTALGGGNTSAVYSFDLNITSVGRKPYFTAFSPAGPYAVAQGEFIQINISANDPDPNSTLTFLDDTSRFGIVTIKSDTNASDAVGQINWTPGNDDVGQYNITITVRDGTLLQNTTTLEFNVTNVNDPPSVNELSFEDANTQDNQNISNLTGYANTPFVYVVNATDPDEQYGDTLNYTDNTSLFDINLTTGRISFTPSGGDVQAEPYSINITTTDNSGAQDSRILYLTINANSPPFFNATLPELECTTDTSCSLGLAGFADDPDVSDTVSEYNITFTQGSLSSFSFNQTTGLINFTPAKQDVGNYTINVTIQDSFGAQNSSVMNITINNTPVQPNLTRFNFSSEKIVETHLFTYELRATDRDFLVPDGDENLTFTTNLSVNYSIAALPRQNTTARATLSFTPGIGDAGNYSIEINATDTNGLVDSKTIIFEILPAVPAPNITNITPWGLGSTDAIQTSFAPAALFTGNTEDVAGEENSTITFALVVDDTRPLTYNWTVDGEENSTSQNITLSFDFFSSGSYTVSVNVSNDRFESSTWTWNLEIQNVNRQPRLTNNLTTPLSINTTFQSQDYFTGGPSTTKFYDPDDDLDGDGSIDGNETSGLTFTTVSSCAAASLSISGADLTITPQSIATCNVRFNATDSDGGTLESNLVLINVTNVPEGETTQTTTSSGGGGGGGSSSIVVPLDNNEDVPQAFHLIAPKLVTVYSNDTVEIPIQLKNTWDDPLEFIRLGAETNDTEVAPRLETDLIETLEVNETREILLTVRNYRLGENYEVLVRANVSDPEYEDEALILLNSIESSTEGEEVDVKVTFANDLLNEHPECQELTEILDNAESELLKGNLGEARRLVDGVINGCKYMVSTQQGIQERPSRINPVITIDNLSLRTIMWSVLAFVILLSISLLLYYHYSYSQEEDF